MRNSVQAFDSESLGANSKEASQVHDPMKVVHDHTPDAKNAHDHMRSFEFANESISYHTIVRNVQEESKLMKEK